MLYTITNSAHPHSEPSVDSVESDLVCTLRVNFDNVIIMIS